MLVIKKGSKGVIRLTPLGRPLQKKKSRTADAPFPLPPPRQKS